MLTKLRKQRQEARSLSLLTHHQHCLSSNLPPKLNQWLDHSSKSHDAKVSSYAIKALLHLKSHTLLMERMKNELAVRCAAHGQNDPPGSESIAIEQRCGPRYGDMVHFLDPRARHHHPSPSSHSLSAQSHPIQQDAGREPDIDIVFVHGIRGGPFVTWRKQTNTSPHPPSPSPPLHLPSLQIKASPPSRPHLTTHSSIWPSDWLPQDFPNARLLTAEYPAPVFTAYEVIPHFGPHRETMD